MKTFNSPCEESRGQSHDWSQNDLQQQKRNSMQPSQVQFGLRATLVSTVVSCISPSRSSVSFVSSCCTKRPKFSGPIQCFWSVPFHHVQEFSNSASKLGLLLWRQQSFIWFSLIQHISCWGWMAWHHKCQIRQNDCAWAWVVASWIADLQCPNLPIIGYA